MTTLNRLLGVLLFILLLTSVTSPPVSHAAFPGTNGQIAFTSTRDGRAEVYVMNPDGSSQIRLTNTSIGNGKASWSADGTMIAFQSYRDGDPEVYVMNADGTNQIRLTNVAGADDNPHWSPDGTQIVFDSDRGGQPDIFIMDADGTNQTNLTNNPAVADSQPAWSPDDTKIAFNSARDGNVEVYVMNADGTNQTRLTNSPDFDGMPDWSPDGTKIVFMSLRDGDQEIYVMNADGTSQTRLTNNISFDTQPGWSPDGTKIAFMSGRDGNQEIYVMDADGSNQVNITNTSANEGDPNWQPLPQTIVPTSYDMLNGNNENFYYLDRSYDGSGDPTQPSSFLSGGLGDLADGIIATQNFFEVEPAPPANGPYVGWDRNQPLGTNPTITFNFGCAANIDSVTVHADDASTGGVSTPLSVVISMGGSSESFAFPDPPGTDPVSATFSLSLNPGTSLALTVNHKTQWIFLSEVTFEGSCQSLPDTTPPVVNVSFPSPDGQNGWFVTSPVMGSIIADDTMTGGSNVTAINCTGATVVTIIGLGTPSASAPLTVSADGVNNVSCTATDSADNSGAGAGSNNTATVQSDTVAPAVLVISPADGESYLLNVAVVSSYNCTDATSGVATCDGPVASGTNFSTSPVGAHAFTVIATDVAGNSAQATNNYSVVYDFSGFFPPVDNPPTLNRIKAGRATPVKFSLNGDQGLNIFNVGFPVSQQIACDTSAPLDDVEETVTAGSSSLSYDAATDQYVYVWKTDKGWAGTCRQLIVQLDDDTAHMAYFNFR